MDLLAEPGPLKPIARSLAEARIAARLLGIASVRTPQRVAHRAGHVAHAAADLHGVGRHDAPCMRRKVREHHPRGMAPRGERERPQVDPRASAHRLIDREAALAAQVAHRVARILRTLRQAPVADIDSVFARLGNVGRPLGRAALRSLGHARRAAHRTLAEGVLARAVEAPQVREPGASVAPREAARRLGIAHGPADTGVVVGHQLGAPHVALARQQHVRPRIFEHRHQERQHVPLRVEVLAGLPQTRTLPAPAVPALIEIASVALPQGDVSAAQPGRRRPGRREPRDERAVRTGGAVGERTHLAPRGRTAAGDGNQLLDAAAVGVELDARTPELRRQQLPHRIVNGLHALLAERVVRKTDRGMDAHAASRGLHAVDAHPASRDFARRDAGEHAGDLLAAGFGNLRCTVGADVRNARQQRTQQTEKTIFHDDERAATFPRR